MKMKKFILGLTIHTIVFVSLVFPVVIFAQTGATNCNSPGNAGTNVCNVIQIARVTIGYLNPILFSLCFVVFFWGLSKFILNSGSKDEIEKGKNYMVWAILALFILISFRAIITFITSDLGFGNSTSTPQIPQA
jgi:hypothetical protein